MSVPADPGDPADPDRAERAGEPARRLVLLRHAKSDRPAGVVDRDRPLAGRGVGDARAAGRLLAAIAPPDVVLCSPARRTRQTWELAAGALTDPPAARFEPTLYEAEVDDVLDLLRALPAEARTALVVGHEPTMSWTATALAGPGSAGPDLDRLRQKFATSGTAVLALPAANGWAQLVPGHARLERFAVPRG